MMKGRGQRNEERNLMDSSPLEVFMPGYFVVLQGIPGDGLSNTIDEFPTYVPGGENEQAATGEADVPSGDDGDHATVRQEPASSNSASVSADDNSIQQRPGLRDLLAEATRHPTTPSSPFLFNSPLTNAVPPSSAAAAASTPTHSDLARRPIHSSQPEESYVVVSDDSSGSIPTTPTRNPEVHNTNDATPAQGSTSIPQTSSVRTRAIDAWTEESRQWQRQHRSDWILQQQQQEEASFRCPMDDEAGPWWLQDGRLAIFDTIPQKISHSRTSRTTNANVIGSLSPGSTAVGVDLHYFDSETWRPLHFPERYTAAPNSNNDKQSNGGRQQILRSQQVWYPHGKMGVVQILQLESPQAGYCFYSIDGYAFFLPGIPTLYIDPRVWWWRVTCSVGAFVRRGLDLSSEHSYTLPYGSFVQVSRKTINAMGLSRLRIHAIVENTPSVHDMTISARTGVLQANNTPTESKVVEGWCSEFLNPLSGQRGFVVQPVPFPVPAIYKVTLAEGAILRSDIELSSPQIGHAPMGELLTVVRRAFSETPPDKCIERLQLAGNGGWISVRLNKPPPADELVVELVGVAGQFQPDDPGSFHWEAQASVYSQQNVVADPDSNQVEEGFTNNSQGNDARFDEISSIDDDEERRSASTESSNQKQQSKGNTIYSCKKASNNPMDNNDDRCLICLTQPRNATIVHGETGHIACCLICARILKAKGDKCPCCRLPIDSVIQHFWA